MIGSGVQNIFKNVLLFQTFTAPITFADLVAIHGDLEVSGELDNGIDTSDLITLSSSDSFTITTGKRFEQAATISGKLVT